MIIHWSAALGAKWCFLGRWEAVMHIGTVAPYGERFPGKGIGAKSGFTGLQDRAQGVFSRFQTWNWVSNPYWARSANGIKLPWVPLECELNPQKRGWQALFTPNSVAELSLEEVTLSPKEKMRTTYTSQKTRAEQELCVPGWPHLSRDHSHVPKIQRQLGKMSLCPGPAPSSPQTWDDEGLPFSRPQVAPGSPPAVKGCSGSAGPAQSKSHSVWGERESWSDCPHKHKCHN